MLNKKTAKPIAEDVIPEILDGEMMNDALHFAAYMRENKMPFKQHTTNRQTQSAKYKGKIICVMVLYDAKAKKFYDLRQPTGLQSWLANLWLERINDYDESIVRDGLQSIVWDNMKYCVWGENSGMSEDYRGCSPSNGCAGGVNISRCGKSLKGVCQCRPYMFWNPGESEIAAIKRLVELEKQARDAVFAVFGSIGF